MNRICGLFAGAVIALVCGGVVGCSDRVEFKWNNSRGTPSIAGFVDDSLVVAYDCREWLETTETWNGAYSEDVSCGHDRLLVYNYRVQEDGPRWTDSLTNERGGYRWYQLTDSIFWRWNGDNILLWKLRGEAHEIKLSRKNEGCSETFDVDRMHQWLDGTFIALGGKLSVSGDSCQYAVLDTVKKVLTYKRFDEDLKWIELCNEVRSFERDVFCIAWNEWRSEGALRRNSNDTVMIPFDFGIGNFWGDVVELGGRFCELNLNNEIVCSGDVQWIRPSTFKNGNKLIFELNE